MTCVRHCQQDVNNESIEFHIFDWLQLFSIFDFYFLDLCFYLMQVGPNLTKNSHIPVYYSSVRDQNPTATNPQEVRFSTHPNRDRQVTYHYPNEVKTGKLQHVQPQLVSTRKTIVYEQPTQPLAVRQGEKVRQFTTYQNQNVKYDETYEHPQVFYESHWAENNAGIPASERRYSQETGNPQFMKLASGKTNSKTQKDTKIKLMNKNTTSKQDCCPFPLIIFLMILGLIGLVLGFLFGMGFFNGDLKNHPHQNRDTVDYSTNGQIIDGVKYSPYSISVEKNIIDKSGNSVNSGVKTDEWGALTSDRIVKEGKNLKKDYSEILEESMKIPETQVNKVTPIFVKDEK